jgi:pyruvate/2-oxoglutarate dehydrogenase complex dihydrolipoamide dehydrogenase (E3) component
MAVSPAHHIVIVGAGFGCLEVARYHASMKVRITVIGSDGQPVGLLCCHQHLKSIKRICEGRGGKVEAARQK